jgi:hypothetical protein
MFDIQGLLGVLLLLFWIWALIDCIAADKTQVRNLPKLAWIVIVVVLAALGGLLWVLIGRPDHRSQKVATNDYSAPRRPVGLEDEPRYTPSDNISDRRSRELDRVLDQWEAEQRAKDPDQRNGE